MFYYIQIIFNEPPWGGGGSRGVHAPANYAA